MAKPGRDDAVVLPDGRLVEFWDGGDPTGRPVIMHPGTPETRVMGRWGHDGAVTAGVRLISINRPGYGASTSTIQPSLLATGRLTAAFAAGLGLEGFGVVGLSGGGPFAVATSVADPSHVRSLGVVGGIGPWRILDDDLSRDPDGARCLALLDARDVLGAWECMRRDVDEGYGGFAKRDDAGRDTILSRIGNGSRLVEDDLYRALWAENMRAVLDSFDGVALDNLAWGGTWDVDPRDVAAPTMLWYGTADKPCPPSHGRWYAERIARSELVIRPGEGHLDVLDAHWPEVLTRLVAIWD